MTRFRPCIDLADGDVVQLVGGTFSDDGAGTVTNHRSDRPASYFAERYRADRLVGGHVVKLGPGNDPAARGALAAWPGGLQVGGGIDATNAADWIEAGAAAVIVTSALFDDEGRFLPRRLAELAKEVGHDRLVVDLSARRAADTEESTGPSWVVVMDRWQRRTNLSITPATLDDVAEFAGEMLIHAADVEGRREGIDRALVEVLGTWGGRPVTYAGGARALDDLDLVERCSSGRVDLTIGSALDLFGGDGVRYVDAVAWNDRGGSIGPVHEP